ncbi:Pr6Pr family membrane protein [Microbacterium sp. A93]|uniref:Pr6Pr family membrane protein n=1 Tax=unclassified Microbacterium TaxID=2609290 RepID=UPI003F425F32
MTSAQIVGITRIAGATTVLGVLGYAYALRIADGDSNPFDYFGYFTNQTTLLTCVILIATGALALARQRVPEWLIHVRAIAVTCLIIVGVIYNVLVPGTGSAPPWVSFVLHILFPIAVLLDWMLIRDRPSMAWRRLWIVLPYPVIWLIVVIVRGVTDGWVPYGFLLPERGALSLWLHIAGLLFALLAAGGVVWTTSRMRAVAVQ